MQQFAEYYSPHTLELVNQFTGSTDLATQQEAIRAIVASDEPDRARLLISLLNYSMWRENSVALLRAIGETNERRGVEFLIRFVRRLDDLPLAAEAVLALGKSSAHLAGEFLLSIVKDKYHCLRREAIVGLAGMPHFPCDELLMEIVNDPHCNVPLQISAIVALGRRCTRHALGAILEKSKANNAAVANACFLAIGHLASSDTIKEMMANTDTDSDLFLSELSLYVEDKVHLREQSDIEDIIVNVLSGANRGWNTRFRIIKEYPPEKVWRVFELLRNDIGANNECLVRAATFVDERSGEDYQFLITHQQQLDVSYAANLLRLCLPNLDSAQLLEFSCETTYELLKCVAIPDLLVFERPLFQQVSDEYKLSFVDALIAQNMMSLVANDAQCDWLFEQFRNTKNRVLSSRIMRGLAQLSYTKKSFINDLREALGADDNAGVYYCLALIPKSFSEKILTDRLDRMIKINDENEIAITLQRLSELGKLENPSVISKLKHQNLMSMDMDVLKILVFNRVPGFDQFIGRTLAKGNVSRQLLAVSAIALNSSKDLCKLLFPLLQGSSSQLKERALHSLCVRGTAKQHAELLTWFAEHSFDAATANKIVRCLVPRESESYQVVVRQLQEFIHKPSGPFADDQLLQELISLSDTLLVHYCKEESEGSAQSIDTHKQDEHLGREIAGFNRYSETVRTILRNAELTWQYKDLFDDNVDKSTMLVQYTKSADLLLQQRVGEKIFHQQDDKLLLAMQGRIMALDIDDKNITPLAIIKRLALEDYFSSAEFPAHKLAAVVKSIMTGKIMQERYRLIDGLRAWALILLLFGRNFSSGGNTYHCILPVDAINNAATDKINSVAARMNFLQDLRNRAAHHGIFVEYTQMTKIRHDSIAMFNELDEIFQC